MNDFPPIQFTNAFRQWVLQYAQSASLDLNADTGDSQIVSQNLAPTSPTHTEQPLCAPESSFIQISGHPNSLSVASPTSVWKRTCQNELRTYQELAKDVGLSTFIPKLESWADYRGGLFIEVENLLAKFEGDVSLMDVKMGTRTFLAGDVDNHKGRADLYDKMVKVCPIAPNEEEHLTGKVTKLRYMQFREEQSSSLKFGFRIEGVKIGPQTLTNLQHLKSEPQIVQILQEFLSDVQMKAKLLRRLEVIRGSVEGSEYFSIHEFIGTSLLIIRDYDKIGCWLIDFAKICPTTTKLKHRTECALNSHEDGYLKGLDSLIQIIESTNF